MNRAQLEAVIRAWNRLNANGSMNWQAFCAAAADLIDQDVPRLMERPIGAVKRSASALDAMKDMGQPRP